LNFSIERLVQSILRIRWGFTASVCLPTFFSLSHPIDMILRQSLLKLPTICWSLLGLVLHNSLQPLTYPLYSTLSITRNYWFYCSWTLVSKEWHLTGCHPNWVVIHSRDSEINGCLGQTIRWRCPSRICPRTSSAQCICSTSIRHHRCSWYATLFVCRWPLAVPEDEFWPSSVSYIDYDICTRRALMVYHFSGVREDHWRHNRSLLILPKAYFKSKLCNTCALHRKGLLHFWAFLMCKLQTPLHVTHILVHTLITAHNIAHNITPNSMHIIMHNCNELRTMLQRLSVM